jgi:hypothetical protein
MRIDAVEQPDVADERRRASDGRRSQLIWVFSRHGAEARSHAGTKAEHLEVPMSAGLAMARVVGRSTRGAGAGLLQYAACRCREGVGCRTLLLRNSWEIRSAVVRVAGFGDGVARRLQSRRLVAGVAPPVTLRSSSRASGTRVPNAAGPIGEDNAERSSDQGTETVIAGSEELENNALKLTRSPGCAWSALAA